MGNTFLSEVSIVGLINFCFTLGLSSSEVCIRTERSSTLLLYCDSGCCGDPQDQYCCPDNLALIVGSTFGVFGFLGILVFLVYFCVKKNNQDRSRVSPLGSRHGRIAGTFVSNRCYGDPDFKHVLQPPPYSLDPPPAYAEISPHSSCPSSYKNDFANTSTDPSSRSPPVNNERMRIATVLESEGPVNSTATCMSQR